MGDVNATLYGNESDYNFNVLKGNVSVNNIENPQNKDGKYYFKTEIITSSTFFTSIGLAI